MFVNENIKTPAIYTHVGSTQKVAIYHNNGKGTYTPRFFVDNYKPKDKKHTQRSFTSFRKKGDALAFAEKICSRLSRFNAKDVFAIEKIVKELKDETKQRKRRT